jgi:alkylhydroperoxidase family enzyme
VTAHAEFLRAATDDELLARRMKADFRQAGVSDRDRTMLEFVNTLSHTPWALNPAGLDGLRRAGFREDEILHVVLGSAHFNYLNRMADGLGIRFEYESELPPFQPRETRPRPAPPPPAAPPMGDLPEEEPSTFYRVVAGNPEACALATKWRAFQLRPTPGLEAVARIRIALFVSSLDRCPPGYRSYRRQLAQLGDDAAVGEALNRGEIPAGLPPRDRLFLEHAARLTLEPWTTRAEHLDVLRSAGVDDRGILQLTMLVSYLSFETRVTLGLGPGSRADGSSEPTSWEG